MKDTQKVIKTVIICTFLLIVMQIVSAWMLAHYISQTAGDIHHGLQQIKVKS